MVNQVWISDAANTYTFGAYVDPEGDAFTYTGLSCLPAGITTSAATRTVSMLAGGAAAGLYTCTVTADDTFTNGIHNTGTFTIRVSSRPV